MLKAIFDEQIQYTRFQLIQHKNDRLELWLIAKNKQEQFAKAKQAIEAHLRQNGVDAKIYLSNSDPSADPISGKFKHVVAKKS